MGGTIGAVGASANHVQGYYNVQDIGGAIGDGVANDLAAILATIAECPANGTVYFPPGTYLVSGSGTELMLIDKSISFYGNRATIKVADGVASTCDVIRFYLSTAGTLTKISFRGMGFSTQSATATARHVINIDLTDGSGGADPSGSDRHCNGLVIEDCIFTNAFGGRSFYLTNPTGADGLFLAEFNRSRFDGGLSLINCGDSIKITGNQFYGSTGLGATKTAIDITQLAISAFGGAAQILIMGNNCTMGGGFCRIVTGAQIKILYNQCEQSVTSVIAESALIALVGTGTQITGVEIIGNNLNAHNPNAVRAIYIDNAQGTYIARNSITTGSSCHITITANADDTILGLFNTDAELNVVNSGVNTRHETTTAGA